MSIGIKAWQAAGGGLPHMNRQAEQREVVPWRGRAKRGWVVVWALACSLGACAPALDWREMRIPEAALTATFPCRPANQRRAVRVEGRAVTMSLHVCDAGGATFALTHTDVGDATQVAAAMRALRATAASNLGVSGGIADQAAWPVAGMTPRPEAGQWRLKGRLPDGRGVAVAMAITSHGTHVVQVSVLAPQWRDAQVLPFLEGLRFAP